MVAQLLVVGADIGGTGIKVCAEGGNLSRRQCQRLAHTGMRGRGINGGPEKLLSLVQELVLDVTEGKMPDAFAFTIPTMLDSESGKLLAKPPNLGGSKKSWLERNLYEDFHRLFGCPVFGGNDVDHSLYAELVEGAITELSARHNAVGIFVGGGVGGAVISKGANLLGSFSSTTEIGHFPMDASYFEAGETLQKCGCGDFGHVEAYASVTALLRRFRTNATVCGADDPAHSSNIGDATKIGDDELCKLIFQLRAESVAADAAIEDMIFGLASVAKTTNIAYGPKTIVFGGGIMGEGKKFLAEIRRKFLELNKGTWMLESARRIDFKLASCGSNAGAIGSMHIARGLL